MTQDTNKTIHSIFNLWFWNFQNPTLQQFSNLYHSTVAIVKFYNQDDAYKPTLENMEKLFFHPIITLNEKYTELKTTKNPLDWNITQLEWCYHRDTKFKSKLSTEYFVDARKVQETKKLTLGEVITVLSLFKLELFNTVVKILIDKKLNIFLNILPTGLSEIEQVRGSDVANH